MTKHSFVGLLFLGLAGLSACAVASSSTGDEQDITGSLVHAKACAVRDAYTAAPLSAFTTLTREQLPPGVQVATAGAAADPAVTYARFSVFGVGDVFVATNGFVSHFFDVSGKEVASAVGDAALSWSPPSGGALSCGGNFGGDAGSKDGGVHVDAGIREASAPDGGVPFCPVGGVHESEPNGTQATANALGSVPGVYCGRSTPAESHADGSASPEKDFDFVTFTLPTNATSLSISTRSSSPSELAAFVTVGGETVAVNGNIPFRPGQAYVVSVFGVGTSPVDYNVNVDVRCNGGDGGSCH